MTFSILSLLFIPFPTVIPIHREVPEDPQYIENERRTVRRIQETKTCGNLRGARQFTIAFRRFQVEFAGVGQKSSGTIYVNTMGKNQRLSSRFGGEFILVV